MSTTSTSSRPAEIEASSDEAAADDWTFGRAPTREHSHCYHDYPARMIPQIAAKLIARFGAKAKRLFDPYCGTGTSLVEGMLRGIDCIGTDLNPLARLIATTKTDRVCLATTDREIARISAEISKQPLSTPPDSIAGITKLDFWFKPAVLAKLTRLSELTSTITTDSVKRFVMVALSETIRDASNTRASEFKLYRYPLEHLKRYNPDVHAIFQSKLTRNRAGLASLLDALSAAPRDASASVYKFNTVDGVPEDQVANRSIDLVVTSPPYGDSRTTVAYGQYSRLSAAWLGLDSPHNIDQRLMGASTSTESETLVGSAIRTAVAEVAAVDARRGAEVVAFYLDLQDSIRNVAALVRRGGHACYVVGNRKVKGVVLPTSEMVKDVFSEAGFSHVGTFTRGIPNKRMPLKNSPSNKTGALDSTMTTEFIVVMKRR